LELGFCASLFGWFGFVVLAESGLGVVVEFGLGVLAEFGLAEEEPLAVEFAEEFASCPVIWTSWPTRLLRSLVEPESMYIVCVWVSMTM
jgi:hypothetical protein